MIFWLSSPGEVSYTQTFLTRTFVPDIIDEAMYCITQRNYWITLVPSPRSYWTTLRTKGLFILEAVMEFFNYKCKDLLVFIVSCLPTRNIIFYNAILDDIWLQELITYFTSIWLQLLHVFPSTFGQAPGRNKYHANTSAISVLQLLMIHQHWIT